MVSNYPLNYCIYPLISTALKSYQRSFFVGWMVDNTEIHNWWKRREKMSVKCSPTFSSMHVCEYMRECGVCEHVYTHVCTSGFIWGDQRRMLGVLSFFIFFSLEEGLLIKLKLNWHKAGPSKFFVSAPFHWDPTVLGLRAHVHPHLTFNVSSEF